MTGNGYLFTEMVGYMLVAHGQHFPISPHISYPLLGKYGTRVVFPSTEGQAPESTLVDTVLVIVSSGTEEEMVWVDTRRNVAPM